MPVVLDVRMDVALDVDVRIDTALEVEDRYDVVLDLLLMRRDALLDEMEDLATFVIDPFKLSPKDDVLCLLMRLDCRF